MANDAVNSAYAQTRWIGLQYKDMGQKAQLPKQEST